MFRQILAGAAAFALLVGPADARPDIAQSPQAGGSITGRVTIEATTEPVHAAQVIVIGARRTAVTDPDGRFEIRNVPAGTYEVLVTREHLTTGRRSITIASGEALTLDFVLGLEAIHEEVTVTASASGETTTFETFNAITSLDSFEIARDMAGSIAEVLEGQPGLAKRTFGPGSARPIVRGFDGDRVLIMQDGIRTGDLSSQSGDHGVTIDPAGLQRIEVVKGPATLLYGSNAIGGVVNTITPHEAFRDTPFAGTIGNVTFDAGTANTSFGANGSVQHGQGPWLIWAGGGSRRAGNYEAPGGAIPNSSTRLSNGRAGAGWRGERAFATLGFQYEESRFGVPFAALFHEHDEEEDEGHSDDESFDVDLAADRLDLRLDTGLTNLENAWVDHIHVKLNYLDYQHRELEILDGEEEVGTTFDNETFVLRAELEQKPRWRVAGRLGIEAQFREFQAVGEESLAPATDQATFAAFVYEEVNLGRARVQFGGRLERNDYSVSPRMLEEHHDDHGDDDHELPEPPEVRDRDFTGFSGSAGLHVDLTPNAAFVTNLTRSSRAPALEELYNYGPHVGNLAFEVGNPDLDTESTLGLDASLRFRGARGRGEINAFLYDISNFVFLSFTDEDVEGLRLANFLQGDARFSGIEASTELELPGDMQLNAGMGYVRALLTGSDEDLPRIPPLQGRVELEIPWEGFTFAPEVQFYADQDRVFRNETPTSGAAVFNVTASYILARRHATHMFTATGYNLTNEEYRLHTSLLKDLLPEIGRGIKFTYAVKFF